MKHYNRLNYEKIIQIGSLLTQCESATELARKVKFDISGLIKHLKEHRRLKETDSTNKCGKKMICTHSKDLCPNCFQNRGYNSKSACLVCKRNCNIVCTEFVRNPACKRLTKFPYVCNGCKKIVHCHLSKLIYEPNAVWNNITEERRTSHSGAHSNDENFVRLSALLCPLIKDKRQSLNQIFLTHKEEIGCSYVTFLKYIDSHLIPNLINLDLTKRVKYPKKYKKSGIELTNTPFLNGRRYDDFVSYIAEHQGCNFIEMDTIVSSHEGSKCLLTLLFRKTNFMFAFLLNSKSTKEVAKVFRHIKETISLELYKMIFQIVLTDNGTGFADPRDIEYDEKSGEKLVSLFYCDPGKSGQKGMIEKNHVELRKFFPKPTIFDYFTQKQINIALSHINSEPRYVLNGNYPGTISKIWLKEKVLDLNEYKFIEPDLVMLSPKLFD